MALINCPECGKEISDRAGECPHCGYPLSESDRSNESVRRNNSDYLQKARKYGHFTGYKN